MKFAAAVVFCLSLLPVTLSHPSTKLTNAKRLAQGLPPLSPRRLYHANFARDPTVSGTPTTTTDTATDTGTGTTTSTSTTATTTTPAAAPTGDISATVVQITQSSPPDRRRQHHRRQGQVGSTLGYLDATGHIQTVNRNVPFTFTADDAGDVHGMWDSNFTPDQTGYLCLSNGHSLDSSRTTPITLSPSTGDYVYVGNCGTDLDQPAGSPPINDVNAVEPQYYGETRVWSPDPSTGDITFHYTNPDGSQVSAFAAAWTCPDFQPATNYFLFVTANLELFLQEILATLQPGSVADPSACTASQLQLSVS